jgi:hypothetical protein
MILLLGRAKIRYATREEDIGECTLDMIEKY